MTTHTRITELGRSTEATCTRDGVSSLNAPHSDGDTPRLRRQDEDPWGLLCFCVRYCRHQHSKTRLFIYATTPGESPTSSVKTITLHPTQVGFLWKAFVDGEPVTKHYTETRSIPAASRHSFEVQMTLYISPCIAIGSA